MAESHILLLPREGYFKWVKATQKYVLAFGVNITPDPSKAGSKENVTLVVARNGYPNEGDIVRWMQTNFPNTHLDAIIVDSHGELTRVLNDRVAKKQRYGSISAAPRTGDTAPVTYSGDRLYLFWPTDYPTVSQAFGANPEIYGKYGLPGHEGVDIRAPLNTNVYACADGEVYFIETDPSEHAYGKHIRIRHDNGYRTVYGHLAEVKVREGQKVKVKEFIGKADSTGNSTGHHLHLTLKKDGATERGETHFRSDIIDPTPFLVYPHQEAAAMEALNITSTSSLSPYPWVNPCLVGLNIREDGSMQEVDFTVMRTAQLEAIKIHENTTSETITRLRQLFPNIFIMARISDPLGQTKITPEAWVSNMTPEFGRLFTLGIRYFEVHQSPNLQMYGLNNSWFSGGGFARWWMDVVGYLKDPFPEAKFGFPGVSPGGQVPGQRLDAKVFLEQADEGIQSADWIGVNCFWSSEAAMTLPERGSFYKYVREMYPDKLLFITEFANVNQLTNAYVKGNEYIKFYQILRNEPGIGAAFSQVMSSRSGYHSMVWRNEDGILNQIPYRVGRRMF